MCKIASRSIIYNLFYTATRETNLNIQLEMQCICMKCQFQANELAEQVEMQRAGT